MPESSEKSLNARPFYERIRPIISEFMEKHSVTIQEWYKGEPHFVIGEVLGTFAKTIQLHIEPRPPEAELILYGFAFRQSFDGATEARVYRGKDFFIAKGLLPRDEERLMSWLEVTWVIMDAVTDEDLVPEAMWRFARSPKPLFGG